MKNIFEQENYKIWTTPILEKEKFFNLTKSEQLLYFITFGVMAPNTHNAQPWAFSFSEHEYSLFVFLNRKRVLPASDKDGRQSIISIGAAIENIAQTAAFFHKKARVQILLNQKEDCIPLKESGEKIYIPVAKITFSDEEVPGSLFLSIRDRKVIRTDYDREKMIEPEILEKIKTCPDSPLIELHLVHDAIRRQAMAEFQGQADSYVINSKKFSRELGDWLLPNDTLSPVGMPGIGFGLREEQAIRMHKGLTGVTKLEPEDGLKFALSGKNAMEKSPFLGFLTGNSDDLNSWIETGRTLERIFLTCTAHGISTAVHAGIVEVPLINRIFSATLGTTKRILAIFRFGYVKDMRDLERPHSPRLSVQEVLLSEKKEPGIPVTQNASQQTFFY